MNTLNTSILGGIETISFAGELYATIIRSQFNKDGISFFTENELSQQLAFMKHPKGKQIAPHVHNAVPRTVEYTQEVLVLRKGSLRVDFYSEEREYLESNALYAGDVILLAKGGHGFEILEDLEMFEIKQGPFVGEADKTRFHAPDSSKIIFRDSQ